MHRLSTASIVNALAAFVFVTTAGAAHAQVQISELLYDGVGADASSVFVELTGPAGASLDGFELVGVNGNQGSLYNAIDLTGNSFGADGVFVIAHTSADAALAAEADLFTTDADFQNGPDSVQLLELGLVVDALGYGDFSGGEVFGGEGQPAPDAAEGESLSRVSDTDDNLFDFVLGAPTPGVAGGAPPPPPGGCAADSDCGTGEACDMTTATCQDVSGWTCNLAYFGNNDGCDCGCGIVDPDCADTAADSCQFCGESGSCSTSGQACPSNIDPNNNAICLPPACASDADCGTDETCDVASGACVPALTGSCGGSCGGSSSSGTCFCDEACFTMGDCCDDVCVECLGDFGAQCGAEPDCAVDADCGANEQCLSGSCVPVVSATDYDVTVDTVDASNFSSVEMIVSVADAMSGDTVGHLDGSNFVVLEDGAPMEDCDVTLISEGQSTPRTDIVFVFDSTGSMSDEIADLKQNILAFTDQLELSNVDFNLGLVVFGDAVEGIYGMTQDADEFRSYVQSVQIGNGSQENPFDAIAAGVQLALRDNSERIFILATDEPPTVVNTSQEDAVQLANASDIRVHAALPPEENPSYQALVGGTGGSFFDLTGSFAAVLDDVVAEIINRYVITCESPRPVRDNSWRHIDVQVTDGAVGGTGTGEYFIEGGSLLVDPVFSVVDIGESFTVDIVANSVTDLQNAHVVLDFDPTWLAFNDAVAGELLGRDDGTGSVQAPFLLYDPAHDPQNGVIAIAIARQSQTGTNGSGVLATLTFTASGAAPDDVDSQATDDLTFALGPDGCFLEDSANREIVVVDVQDGDIDTNGCGLLGDFDSDCDIDIVDFNTLVGTWGQTGAGMVTDIGPADGLPPNMLPNADEVVNFHDLFVFTRMYNWFRFGTP